MNTLEEEYQNYQNHKLEKDIEKFNKLLEYLKNKFPKKNHKQLVKIATKINNKLQSKSKRLKTQKSPEDYVIAIQSYNRPDTLQKATLSVLKEYNIDPKKIHIFLGNKEQKKIYKSKLDKNTYHKLIIGKPGVRNIRNTMGSYFKEGTMVYFIDDDIYELFECVYNHQIVLDKLTSLELDPSPENIKKWLKKGNVLRKLPDLHKFIVDSFTYCQERDAQLFGIYPTHNPYFMKPTNPHNLTQSHSYCSYDLKYIIGYCCGAIINHSAELRTVDDKEDYERSLKYYLLNGEVIRFNNIVAKTKCYQEPGGMQTEGHRSWERVDLSAKYLVAKYTDLCKLKKTNKKKSDKKTGKPWTEITMRDTRGKKTDNPKVFGVEVLREYTNSIPIDYEEFVKNLY